MEKRLFTLFLFYATTIFATDDSPRTVFFDSIEVQYRKEIVECGDNIAYMSKTGITQWKEHMISVSQTPEYKALLQEYRKFVDSSNTPLPCKVLAWNEQRKQIQLQKEDSLTKELILREDYENALREKDSLPKSVFDPFGIPFEISKRSFLLLFKEKCKNAYVDMGYHLYVSDMNWCNHEYLTAFYFDHKTDKFIKYEIESDAVEADKLNRITRQDGENLTQCLIPNFGLPSKTFRIGFFDIKSNALSPLSMWDADGFNVYVGLSMSKYRYFAKAVVSRSEDHISP